MSEANDDIQTLAAPDEVAPQPRRRGRPKGSGRKKDPETQTEPDIASTPASAEPAAAAEEVAETPKRRGRRPNRPRPEPSESEAEPEQDTRARRDTSRETQRDSDRDNEARAGTSDARNNEDDADESDERTARSSDQGDRGDTETTPRRGRNSRNSRRPTLNYRDLQAKILPELHLLAIEVGLSDYRQLSKDELAVAILERASEAEGLRLVKGYLEISSDGYGFLQESLLQNNTRSVIVSAGLIKQFKLRTGDFILGKARRPRDNERYGTLIRVEAVNGVDPFQAAKRPRFDDLTPTFPEERIRLETTQNEVAARVIDLLAPIGRGQRGLIVAPPKAGKTTLLKKIANSVVQNEPDIKVIVLLVDERPEEVTDFRESVSGVEVIASTFDEPPTNHIRVAEFVHERSRRIVEEGGHVMILLDSITRLARANNLVTPPTGRTLSGGLDSSALHWPKRFLGAARNIRGGGSLSILATALVETGSRMDDVIFEEFKGTGNMELHLSRRLEERRIFPAIDILKSGTRREDLLLGEDVLAKMWLLRKVISDMDPAEAMDMLLSRMSRVKTNGEFLSSLGQG